MMKDYRLSEMLEICDNNNVGCDNCEFSRICNYGLSDLIEKIDIEPRDMVELPCKYTYTDKNNVEHYLVYYRDKFTGGIDYEEFAEYWEMEEFIKELKLKQQGVNTIKLPYKFANTYTVGVNSWKIWKVVYKTAKGLLCEHSFESEAKADEFLEKMKKGRRKNERL